MTAATMVSVESSVPSSHHQVVTSFSLDPARPESPAAEVSVPEAASASHPPPQCASVHQQNIALRRQNRRHKLKLDITAAGHHHYHHRTLKLNLLSPGQSPPCDLAPPAGVPHLLMPSELSYSQGLKPIENQIGNPDFVRVRKPVSGVRTGPSLTSSRCRCRPVSATTPPVRVCCRTASLTHPTRLPLSTLTRRVPVRRPSCATPTEANPTFRGRCAES